VELLSVDKDTGLLGLREFPYFVDDGGPGLHLAGYTSKYGWLEHDRIAGFGSLLIRLRLTPHNTFEKNILVSHG
jgi:hypothetical protein